MPRNDPTGIRKDLTEEETKQTERLYALCASIPACRNKLVELVRPSEEERTRMFRLLYLFSGTSASNILKGKIRRGVPFMSRYLEHLDAITEEFWKFHPDEDIEEVVFMDGDIPPSVAMTVSSFASSVMTATRKFPAFRNMVKEQFPEMGHALDRYAADSSCQCRVPLREAIQRRVFALNSLSELYKTKSGDDPREQDPAEVFPDPVLKKENRLDGYGEVFYCDANDEAFKATMRDIYEHYNYGGISVDTSPDGHPGRWRIFLG